MAGLSWASSPKRGQNEERTIVLGGRTGGLEVRRVIEVGLDHRHLGLVARLLHGLLQESEVLPLAHEGERLDPIVLELGGERAPVGLAQDVVGVVVDEVPPDLLPGLDVAGLLDDQGLEVAVEDARALHRLGELLGHDLPRRHLEQV